MDNGVSKTDLLRLIGCMAVCVGVAWAIQVLGFGGDGTALGRMMWVLGAASIAGGGSGAIYASAALGDEDPIRA